MCVKEQSGAEGPLEPCELFGTLDLPDLVAAVLDLYCVLSLIEIDLCFPFPRLMFDGILCKLVSTISPKPRPI